MKNLFALSLLATLVSCGGSSGSKSQAEPFIENFKSALEAQQVGMVVLDQSTGHRNKIASNNGVYSTSKENYSNEYEKETILKIEGDLVYKYKETFREGHKSVEVTLTSKSKDVKDSEEMMKRISMKTQGDRLVGSITMQSDIENDGGEGQIQMSGGTTTITLSISKSNMLCDHNSTLAVKDLAIKTSSQTLKLFDEYEEKTGSCPKSLSTAELKKIDLSNIEFCDESAGDENVNCDIKDMSFLTAAL